MKVIILAVCVALAASSHPEPPRYGGPPAYHPPEPSYHPEPVAYSQPKPAYHPKPTYEEPTEPPQYAFEYGVQAGDAYNAAAYQHNEDRDYEKTVGSYRVELPDGRTQIVTYEDTGYGFVANVQYEGEAQYPPEKEYKPKHHEAPKYAPAPYHPPPTYA